MEGKGGGPGINVQRTGIVDKLRRAVFPRIQRLDMLQDNMTRAVKISADPVHLDHVHTLRTPVRKEHRASLWTRSHRFVWRPPPSRRRRSSATPQLYQRKA